MTEDPRVGRRRTVNMNEEIAQELNKLANSEGKTLYSLINEMGSRAVEAKRRGFDLEGAVRAKQLLQTARKSRMVLVNQDLWYFASSLASRTSKNKWLKLVRNSAQWQSSVFLNGANESALVESLRNLIGDFFWDCTELRLEPGQSRQDLELTAIFVPEMPLDHTHVVFKALEVMLNVQGYVAIDSVVKPGYLNISFKKLGDRLSVKRD